MRETIWFVIVDRCLVRRVNCAMRFRELLVTLTFGVMCASFLAGQAQSNSETGVEGVITIGPIKAGPVRADAPDSRPLANTAFAVENQKGEVTSFTTDGDGRFRVPLPPGHYKVSLKGRKGGIGFYGPFETDVMAGQMTKVEWQCDSKIR
ncbi:MAG TPA: carboxypeptidase-like regulatory domain-containing protein [Candidatus Udaeobacter sp.]